MRHKSWAPIVDYIREAEAVRSGRRAAGVDTSFVARNDASISTEQLIVPVHSIFGSANNGLEAGSIMTSAWPSRQHHLLRCACAAISRNGPPTPATERNSLITQLLQRKSHERCGFV